MPIEPRPEQADARARRRVVHSREQPELPVPPHQQGSVPYLQLAELHAADGLETKLQPKWQSGVCWHPATPAGPAAAQSNSAMVSIPFPMPLSSHFGNVHARDKEPNWWQGALRWDSWVPIYRHGFCGREKSRKLPATAGRSPRGSRRNRVLSHGASRALSTDRRHYPTLCTPKRSTACGWRPSRSLGIGPWTLTRGAIDNHQIDNRQSIIPLQTPGLLADQRHEAYFADHLAVCLAVLLADAEEHLRVQVANGCDDDAALDELLDPRGGDLRAGRPADDPIEGRTRRAGRRCRRRRGRSPPAPPLRSPVGPARRVPPAVPAQRPSPPSPPGGPTGTRCRPRRPGPSSPGRPAVPAARARRYTAGKPSVPIRWEPGGPRRPRAGRPLA